jgi:hypothetical protein
MLAWLLRELAYWHRVHGPRTDGVTATRASNGWYTRHRTDL